MSWESATAVLFEREPTTEQIDAFRDFFEKNHRDLETCCAAENRGQRRVFAKFITQLFSLHAKPVPKNATPIQKRRHQEISKACALVKQNELFRQLIEHALQERDELLLQVVYSLLFNQIRFSDDLIKLWFEHRLKVREAANVASYTDLAYALEVLTTVEFINLRQDLMEKKHSKDLLKALNEAISKSDDKFLSLTWGLCLFILANQLHRVDTLSEEIVDIESLLTEVKSEGSMLRSTSSAHWSSLLLDLISASVPGLGTLVEAYAVVEEANLEIANKQHLSQTVADVISHLAPITEPNIDILRALAFTIRNHEPLKSEAWLPKNIYLAVHAGVPFTFEEMVYIAQTLNRTRRASFLELLHSYISEVDVDCLELPNNAKELDSSLISQPVRSTCVVTILPPRPTDLQGALEVEPNTKGYLVSFDNKLCLVSWRFDYNGWSLLGRILENAIIKEDLNWSTKTKETLRLTTMAAKDANILKYVSSGLARGDILDLVFNNLQLWLQYGHSTLNPPIENFDENISLALEFLLECTRHHAGRIWVFMKYINWHGFPKVCIDACGRILSSLMKVPHNHKFSALQREVIDKYAILFSSQYAVMDPFNENVLVTLLLLLPHSELLQQSFLSSSELREESISPLLRNLESSKVLEFCSECLGMISADPKYTSTDDGVHTNANSKFVNRKQTHLERKLFEKTSTLVTLFLERPELRQLILNIWTVLIENPDSPSLLAFLNDSQIPKLQHEFISILSNRMEPVETIGDLAAFLASTRQQEGLLDMLRTSVMVHIEARAQHELRDGVVSDINTLRAIFDALKLSKNELKPATIKKLESVISQNTDNRCIVEQVSLKASAIELLGIQMRISPRQLEDFAQHIGSLTSKLAVVCVGERGGSGLLSQLLRVWCSFLVIASDHAIVSKARKSDWARRLLVAESIKNVSSSLSNAYVQSGEIMRFETALYILSRNGTATFELVRLLLNEIVEVSECSVAGVECPKEILLALMQSMAWILTRIDELKEKFDDLSNADVCKLIGEVFDVTLIQQLQTGVDENLLKPQLLIFDMLLLLPNQFAPDSEQSNGLQQSLQRAIVESGCDRALINALAGVGTDRPQFGELLLRFAHKILPLNEYTANSFVKNGITNVLIDAPLCFEIQQGGITPYRTPGLHSLWRDGILPTLNCLLSALGVRVAAQVWVLLDAYSKQALTCIDQWHNGYITLELVQETMELFAVVKHVSQFLAQPEGCFEVDTSVSKLLKVVKFLLSHRQYLSERVVPGQEDSAVLEALESFEGVIKSSFFNYA